MAIAHFTNASKGQSRSGMGAVMKYSMQKKKTMWEDMRLVSGVNCTPHSAYDDFLRTQLQHNKDSGRRYYHLVQSFPKGEVLDPKIAHQAAVELAGFFSDREVLVCTHVDREHLHSHLIINAVAMESGRKLHSDRALIESVMKFNDEVCLKYELPVFQPKPAGKRKVKSMSNAEYHAAAKGDSWKMRLINTIDECMRYTATKEEFLSLLRSEGYDVRWTDSRKNITYTTPDGMKCRDDRLHEEKYLKEKMEFEFRIRAQIIYGRTETTKRYPARGSTKYAADEVGRRTGRAGQYDQPAQTAAYHYRDAPYKRAVGASVGYDGFDRAVGGLAASDHENDLRRAVDTDIPAAGTEGYLPLSEADGNAAGGGIDPAVDGTTGWEKEREVFLAFQSPSAEASMESAVYLDPDGDSGLAGDIVRLGRSLEMIAGPVMDATTMAQHHTDRKQLRKEREKKIAQGHAPDDHEEAVQFTMTM